MLMLKSPLVFGIFFVVVSLSAPLVATPMDRGEESDDHLPGLQEGQWRRASENGDNSSQQQRGTMPHAKDWDDLLNDQPQQSEEVTSLSRAVTIEQLSQVTRQAYARGDENHPDWNQVAGLIEELKPENNRERRLSVGAEAEAAEAEQLQYHFLHETLPAIKKVSVIVAMRSPDTFQAAGLGAKIKEVQQIWEEANKRFFNITKEELLAPIDFQPEDSDSTGLDASFLDDTLHEYRPKFIFEKTRWEIEASLSQAHYDIMQNMIQANVCTKDFETRVFSNTEIAERYQPFLAAITAKKESAEPVVQYKWEQFQQEAAARCLEDVAQVAKIKLWQNRNRVSSINKLAERAHEQAERSSVAHGAAAWERALLEGKEAQDAWIDRNNHLAAARENIDAQKTTLSLNISTAIEKEIDEALNEAKERVAFWGASFLSMECLKKYNEALIIHREKTILQKEIDGFPELLKKAIFDDLDDDVHQSLCQENKLRKKKVEGLTSRHAELFDAAHSECKIAISAFIQGKENISIEQQDSWERRLEILKGMGSRIAFAEYPILAFFAGAKNWSLEQIERARLGLEQSELERSSNTTSQRPPADGSALH